MPLDHGPARLSPREKIEAWAIFGAVLAHAFLAGACAPEPWAPSHGPRVSAGEPSVRGAAVPREPLRTEPGDDFWNLGDPPTKRRKAPAGERS